MATITKGKTFTNGELVTPASIHQLVDAATVSNITNTDIAANAAIADSKLAQITTAGKVLPAAVQGTAVVTTDSRLSDARTPVTHTHDDRYYTETEIDTKLSGLPVSGHTHTIANVTGLQTALDGKQASGSYAAASHTHDDRYYTESEIDTKLSGLPVSGHTHTIANVTGLQTALDGKQASGSYAAASHGHDDRYYTESEIDTKLSGLPVSGHTHTIANVTGLQTALDGKQASGSYAAASHTHAISDTTGLQAALDGKQASGNYITNGAGVTEIRRVTAMPATPNSTTLYIVIP